MAIIGIAVLAVGGFCVAYAYVEIVDALRTRRQNEAIASADLERPFEDGDGPTAVEGTVVADDTLPVGPAGSVVVEGTVWQYDHDEDNDYLDLNDSYGVPFYVDTGRRKVPVGPESIDVEASAERTVEETVAAGESHADVLRQYVQYRDLGRIPPGGKRDYEVERIEPGDGVVAFGETERRKGRTVLVEGEGPFFVTDDDPQSLRERRKHDFKKAVLKGGAAGVAGLAVLLAGVVVLFA